MTVRTYLRVCQPVKVENQRMVELCVSYIYLYILLYNPRMADSPKKGPINWSFDAFIVVSLNELKNSRFTDDWISLNALMLRPCNAIV